MTTKYIGIRSEKILESFPVDPALLERANWWFDASWYGLLLAGAATAIAACATVAFLFLQFWSSGVRERQSEWRTSALELQTQQAKRDTAAAQERIAGLNKETAKLGADAESARSAIAGANARAAEATQKAAEAQLALERFRAPRTLTPGQQQVFLDKLLPFAGTNVRVWTLPTGSPDISALADLLIEILNRANWAVGRATSLSGRSFPGVIVAIRNGSNVGPQAAAIVEYLNSIGIDARMAQSFDDDSGLMPASNMSGPQAQPDIVIVVGSKT